MEQQNEMYLKERIIRENRIRQNWFRDHWEKREMAPANKARSAKLTLPKFGPVQDTGVTKEVGARRAPSPTPALPPITCTEIMRPVSCETKNVLCEGFPDEGGGRKKYLLLRRQQNPEEKYRFPVTSNLVYGWDIGNIKTPSPPEHGLKEIVRMTSYRKNGIFPITSPSDSVA